MVIASLAACGLIVAVLVSMEAGHRIGVFLLAQYPQRARTVPPAIEAAVFGLMGLLIAFTFYGAGTRFDNRRTLAASEANAIGTTYLRLDLLPPETQPGLRKDFRMYVNSRMAVYRAIPDIKAVKAALDQSSVLQHEIWKNVVEAAK